MSRERLEQLQQWLISELQEAAKAPWIAAQDHLWAVVAAYLKQTSPRLDAGEIAALREAMFGRGIQSSWLVGILPAAAIGLKLESWCWTQRDIANLPGWAYRLFMIRTLIEAGETSFSVLIEAIRSHPLSEADREALEFARNYALDDLVPVYDADGRLVEGQRLTDEKQRLRKLVVNALAKRDHPLKLSRAMYKSGKAAGIFRDYEELAITEVANCFQHGSFKANQLAGRFRDQDLVYRLPRPQGCALCLCLYLEPNGTPRLFQVRELWEGKTKAITLPGQTNLHRVEIGVAHGGCLCAGWIKYHPEAMPKLFERHRRKYLEARRRHQLPVSWRDRLRFLVRGSS